MQIERVKRETVSETENIPDPPYYFRKDYRDGKASTYVRITASHRKNGEVKCLRRVAVKTFTFDLPTIETSRITTAPTHVGLEDWRKIRPEGNPISKEEFEKALSTVLDELNLHVK